jgi:hypothetical protein
MRKMSRIRFFSLLIVILISAFPILAYGILVNGTQVIFDITYKPTTVIPDDEVTVTCAIEGVFVLSFIDDFERIEIGNDWTSPFGEWSIENGTLIQSEVNNLRLSFAGNITWSNYRVKLKVKKVGTVENNLDIIFRKGLDTNLTDLYILSLRNDGETVAVYRGDGGADWNAGWVQLDQRNFQHTADTWYNVLIQTYNDTIKMKIWNREENEPAYWFFELSDGTYEMGKIGLSCGNQAAFDDIEVYTYQSNFLIQEISLWYNVNNGTFTQMSMNPIGNGQYNVTIPKQTGETQVSFYIEIADDVGNRVNSEILTYVVQTLPPPQLPWFTIFLSSSAIVIIIVVWFAFRKGYLAIEIVE